MAFSKRFQVSDESVNCYGFWIRTAGIRLDNAKLNCPAYYNHNTSEIPLGHWEDIRMNAKGGLEATLVIEGFNEREKEFIRKIENGDIKASSGGFDVIEWNSDQVNLKQGQTVATLWDSELFEISLAPLPGNKNALALKNKETMIKLSEGNAADVLPKLDTMDYKKQLLTTLALPVTATNEEIRLAIEKRPIIDPVAEMVDKALLEKKIYSTQKEFYLKAGAADPEGVKKHLEELPIRMRVSEMIRQPNQTVGLDKKDRTKWKLNDWRKHDPAALRKDPELYERLLKEG